MERVILHCDMNNFFASVECRNKPFLWNEPVAVAGNVDDRQGIILAKNEAAKKYGVKTAEAIWEARRKCKNLVVLKPHFDEYIKYSKLAREIYSEYTNMVEPFGMDECWLDVTGSTGIFGSGEAIADILRERIKNELGLTISVGVSFNKVFAKLGSDMKKPDAVTVISKEKFKEIIWKLPVGDIIGVGKSTLALLNRSAIYSIGDVACCKKKYIAGILGKRGDFLWNSANGLDNSPVAFVTDSHIIKSIGNSTTCPIDLTEAAEVWKIILEMSEMVSTRLRKEKLKPRNVVLTVKSSNFTISDISDKMEMPSNNALDIARCAMTIFKRSYTFRAPVRSIGVRACDLIGEDECVQQSFFFDYSSEQKNNSVDKSVDIIRKKYGTEAIKRGVLLDDEKIFRVNKTKENMFIK